MDIEKLIERLNCTHGDWYKMRIVMMEAITALSMFQAETAKLWAENENLRAELKQVKEEWDAAVQCIRGIAKSGRVWMCPHCVHAKDTTGGIAECELDIGVCMMPYSSFEWCGKKED